MTNLNTIKTKMNITDFRDCRICSFFYNEDRVQHNPSILKRELKTLRGVDMSLQLTMLSLSIATRSNFVQNLFNVTTQLHCVWTGAFETQGRDKDRVSVFQNTKGNGG